MRIIGRLEPVPVTDVWGPEPQFTKWLEENPDVLGDALGCKIQSLSSEQRAGDFQCDLVGTVDQDNDLIIENQYGRSNHDHLGKLLTYFSAFDARKAVWVVEEPRSEHVKVIAQLNDSMQDAQFYLVKIEAVQIADSLPAPKLTLIVGPGEQSVYVKNRKNETRRELAERHYVRKEFWTELINKHKKKHFTLFANRTPGVDSWIGAGVGVSGLMLSYVIRMHDSQVELYIDKYDTEEENEQLFNQLLEHKEQIEKSFGEGLDWQELPGKRAFRIANRIDLGGLLDRDKWDQIQNTMIDAMSRLHNALKPYIDTLQV